MILVVQKEEDTDIVMFLPKYFQLTFRVAFLLLLVERCKLPSPSLGIWFSPLVLGFFFQWRSLLKEMKNWKPNQSANE